MLWGDALTDRVNRGQFKQFTTTIFLCYRLIDERQWCHLVTRGNALLIKDPCNISCIYIFELIVIFPHNQLNKKKKMTLYETMHWRTFVRTARLSTTAPTWLRCARVCVCDGTTNRQLSPQTAEDDWYRLPPRGWMYEPIIRPVISRH